jgi:hypothetical protein
MSVVECKLKKIRIQGQSNLEATLETEGNEYIVEAKLKDGTGVFSYDLEDLKLTNVDGHQPSQKAKRFLKDTILTWAEGNVANPINRMVQGGDL